jgi:hypothetical protein
VDGIIERQACARFAAIVFVSANRAKETASARGHVEAILLGGMPDRAAQHVSDHELKFCLRAANFEVARAGYSLSPLDALQPLVRPPRVPFSEPPYLGRSARWGRG